MRALANDRRRALMEMLRAGEKSVTELAAQFDVARPAISRHLRLLREAGLVQFRSDHNVRYYSLRQPEIERLRDSVSDAFEAYWLPQGVDEEGQAAGVETVRRGFHEVRVAVELPIECDLAFRYCTEETLFRDWVGEDGFNEGTVGGKFGAVSAFGGRLEGVCLAQTRPSLLVNRLVVPLDPADNLYLISFDETATGTRMELRHFVTEAAVATLVEKAWSETFAVLKAMLGKR